MSKTKTAPKPQADRHKSRKMTAVHRQFIDPAGVLMARLGVNTMTALVNLAIREKLEREGLWPTK